MENLSVGTRSTRILPKDIKLECKARIAYVVRMNNRSPSPKMKKNKMALKSRKVRQMKNRTGSPFLRKTSNKTQMDQKQNSELSIFQPSPPKNPMKIHLIGSTSTRKYNGSLRQSVLQIKKNCKYPYREWLSLTKNTPTTYCSPLYRVDFHQPRTMDLYDIKTTNIKMVQNLLYNLLSSLNVETPPVFQKSQSGAKSKLVGSKLRTEERAHKNNNWSDDHQNYLNLDTAVLNNDRVLLPNHWRRLLSQDVPMHRMHTI